MKSIDPIYGKTEINEPVLVELLDSKYLQRLKGISQYGIPDKYYFKKNFNRYEHSLGVMILLRRLKAPLEEQVAGLLHDISVTSFSHVGDWVFSEGHKGKEDYHNTIHENFVSGTDIPLLLHKHGFSSKRILDDENFPLLENNLPDICADRVDYSLREIYYEEKNLSDIKKFLTSLIVYRGQIVFSDAKAASLFANKFLDLQVKHWASEEAVKRYHLFSGVLKEALRRGILTKRDFWENERFILKKLKESKTTEIDKVLTILEEGNLPKDGERVYKKFRHIDPLVLTDGILIRISEIDNNFARRLEKEKSINLEGMVV